jgi:phage gpG-like protein
MQYVISSKGSKAVNDRLERMVANLEQTRSLMLEIQAIILIRQKALYGRGKSLSAATLANKARYGFPSEKLVRTGALKESLTTAEGGEHGIREVGDTSLLFGTTAWYGVFAKRGTKFEPKRAVISFGPAMRRAIREVVFLKIFAEEMF